MGRLLHTINFALSVFVIQYFYHYQVLRKKHYLYVGGLLGLIGLGVFMYFLRVLSSLAFNNMVNKSFFDQMTEFFKLESLFKFLIEKGNIPNIPVLMKIIDSWESDIGFYMGKSYFTWLYNVLPSTIRPVDYQTSFVIKNRWYSALLGGGSIPPTGIGEMYLNFGFFGVIFGMFFFGVLMAYTYNLLNKFNIEYEKKPYDTLTLTESKPYGVKFPQIYLKNGINQTHIGGVHSLCSNHSRHNRSPLHPYPLSQPTFL